MKKVAVRPTCLNPLYMVRISSLVNLVSLSNCSSWTVLLFCVARRCATISWMSKPRSMEVESASMPVLVVAFAPAEAVPVLVAFPAAAVAGAAAVLFLVDFAAVAVSAAATAAAACEGSAVAPLVGTASEVRSVRDPPNAPHDSLVLLALVFPLLLLVFLIQHPPGLSPLLLALSSHRGAAGQGSRKRLRGRTKGRKQEEQPRKSPVRVSLLLTAKKNLSFWSFPCALMCETLWRSRHSSAALVAHCMFLL